MLWLWTVMWCLLAGSSGEGKSPKEVTGILGESATFLLESPKTFDEVLWIKYSKQVASLRREPPQCQLRLFGAYESRDVAVSQDCGSLTVRGLREEDSAGYAALMRKNLQVVHHQTFILRVFRSSGEGESPKEVTGILGESATFLLESPQAFEAVLWLRNEVQVAILIKGPRCNLTLLEAYLEHSRDVTVSQDCGSLTVRGLREEDSAGYKAHMQNNLQIVERQTFILKVYKRLSEADLKVTCVKGTSKDGNKTLHLNCSVGDWEGDVKFKWTLSSWSGKASFSENSLVLHYNPQDDDGNATCMAHNPVSQASRTVSLKQACAEVPALSLPAGEQQAERPRATANPETESFGGLSGGTIGVTIAASIVAKVIISVCVFAKWPHCTKGREIQRACPASA